jgi:hypothetical protein
MEVVLESVVAVVILSVATEMSVFMVASFAFVMAVGLNFCVLRKYQLLLCRGESNRWNTGCIEMLLLLLLLLLLLSALLREFILFLCKASGGDTGVLPAGSPHFFTNRFRNCAASRI